MANLEDRTLVSSSDFSTIKRFLEVKNACITYKCQTAKEISSYKTQRKLEPNTEYFVKFNTTRGSKNGATSESHGTCEDVGEVYSYFLLRNIKNAMGQNYPLECAWYDFAEYLGRENTEQIYSDTNGLIQSSRQYGCITKNILAPRSNILRGSNILANYLANNEVYKPDNNTIYNYAQALNMLQKNATQNSMNTAVSEQSTRFLCNTIFWDYFATNSDRHCDNITFQGKYVDNGIFIEPTKIIDNGATFLMLSFNCFNTYTELNSYYLQSKVVPQSNNPEDIRIANYRSALNYKKLIQEKVTNNSTEITYKNPIEMVPSLKVGSECFADRNIAKQYDEYLALSKTKADKIEDIGFGARQIVLLVSQNKDLFNDFKGMYENINPRQAYADMIRETIFDRHFLPGFEDITSSHVILKQAEISQAISEHLNIEFNEETFIENPSYYLQKLEQTMVENNIQNNLTINIQTTEENLTLNEDISTQNLIDQTPEQ